MTPRATSSYPIPGPIGGRLIREVIALLRSEGVGLELPLSSHILIAYSAGLDSTALAHLLVRYGRRVGGADQIRLIHINHGWRGAESDADEQHARDQARAWGVPIDVIRLKAPSEKSDDESAGRSWEELAREARAHEIQKLAARYGENTCVFTAHHADDQAETLLWRLFTGQAATHGAGILARQGNQIRPLLRVRKSTLKAFLEEEKLSWREDRTNHEGRFLRSRMRQELMPAIERLFPKAISHLLEASAGTVASATPTEAVLFNALGLEGVKTRRAHWRGLAKLKAGTSLSLPGGWTLRRELKSNQNSYKKGVKKQVHRWVLEKAVTAQKNTKKQRETNGR